MRNLRQSTSIQIRQNVSQRNKKPCKIAKIMKSVDLKKSLKKNRKIEKKMRKKQPKLGRKLGNHFSVLKALMSDKLKPVKGVKAAGLLRPIPLMKKSKSTRRDMNVIMAAGFFKNKEKGNILIWDSVLIILLQKISQEI